MTGTRFDPYHRWLGIPPKHQPPDYYRLLALERFEDDEEVIRDAAEQRIAHVRNYRLGEHAEFAHQLLNGLGRAKACLLDQEKKSAYDASLRGEATKQQSDIKATPTQSEDTEEADIFPDVVDDFPAVVRQEHSSAIRSKQAKSSSPTDRQRSGLSKHASQLFASHRSSIVAAAICLFFVVVALVFVIIRLRGSDADEQVVSDNLAASASEAAGGIETASLSNTEDSKIVESEADKQTDLVARAEPEIPTSPGKWDGESKPHPDAVQFAGNWYWFTDVDLTYSEAFQLAEKLNGRLLIVSSDDENEFVHKFASQAKRSVLLGLTRDREGKFAAPFANWYPGQPGNRGEPNVELSWGDGRWHNTGAHVRLCACIEWGLERQELFSSYSLKLNPQRPSFRLKIEFLGDHRAQSAAHLRVDVAIKHMWDDEGDGGMYYVLADGEGNQLAKVFGNGKGHLWEKIYFSNLRSVILELNDDDTTSNSVDLAIWETHNGTVPSDELKIAVKPIY